MTDIAIRHAEQDDLPELLAIYNHYVVHTPITFDLEPRTLAQRREWFDEFAKMGKYQCFVAIDQGRPLGWVCSAKFKEKAAYSSSVETSVYLAPGEIGKGIGAHDAERDLTPVDERGTADAVAPGDHVRGGQQVAVGCENDAAATTRRSPPAARGAQDAEVGHAGRQALGYA